MVINRHLVRDVDTYTFAVYRWSATRGTFVAIKPSNNKPNPLSFPAVLHSRYSASGPLPAGYVGMFAFGLTSNDHVDWDNFSVNW